MLKIKEEKMQELKSLGFKPDNRKDIAYSIIDDLFGDIIKIRKDRTICRNEFSDRIYFLLLGKDFIEKDGE